MCVYCARASPYPQHLSRGWSVFPIALACHPCTCGSSKWYPDLAPQYLGDVIGDVVWNLKTWPLELVDWPVHNRWVGGRVSHLLTLGSAARCAFAVPRAHQAVPAPCLRTAPHTHNTHSIPLPYHATSHPMKHHRAHSPLFKCRILRGCVLLPPPHLHHTPMHFTPCLTCDGATVWLWGG